MKKITNDILWDFADGLLPTTQQKEVELLLANNPALQQQLNVILQKKALLSYNELEQPSVDFASNLLGKWALIQQTQHLETIPVSSNIRFLKILFISFIAMSISLSYIVFSTNNISEPLQIGIPTIEIPWSKISFMLVSILAMLSVLLLEKMMLIRYVRLGVFMN